MKIEIFRGTNREWYFRIRARNRRVLAQSESYKRKAGAINAVAKMIVGLPNAKLIYLK